MHKMHKAFKALAFLLALGLGAAQAEPLLTQGGAVFSSRFCQAYSCRTAGTVKLSGARVRAYRLSKVPGVGVLLRGSGRQVDSATMLVLDPMAQSDEQLLRALRQVLPDFQLLSFGKRHAFSLAKQCLRASTVGKAVPVGGKKVRFTCVYNNPKLRMAVARSFHLSPKAGLISVTYAKP